jgi:hypothetical protein
VDSIDLAQDKDRHMLDCCEHGNEPWSSIKCGEFPDRLSKFYVLKQDSNSWSRLFVCLFV